MMLEINDTSRFLGLHIMMDYIDPTTLSSKLAEGYNPNIVAVHDRAMQRNRHAMADCAVSY